MDPMPFNFDFMVQPTATYLTIHQVELVFGLLKEKVDPISIPEYVRQRLSGVDLTVEDVKALRDGNFHVSGSGFYVRMATSGNLMSIDAVDEFFRLLPKVTSLADIRPHLEEEYGFTISDADLLDLCDGGWHIDGPRTIEITTRDKVFMPKAYFSEALWLYGQGCTSEFLSAYAWYKFHAYLPAAEVVRLALKADQDLHEALNPTVKSGPWTSAFQPNCMKRSSRRAPPPPPIITACPVPRDIRGAEAVRLDPGSNSDSDYSLNCHDSSHAVVHHKDGDFIIDRDQPDTVYMPLRCMSPCFDPMAGDFPELPDTAWIESEISRSQGIRKLMANADQNGLPSFRELDDQDPVFIIGSPTSSITSEEEGLLNPNLPTNPFDDENELLMGLSN